MAILLIILGILNIFLYFLLGHYWGTLVIGIITLMIGCLNLLAPKLPEQGK